MVGVGSARVRVGIGLGPGRLIIPMSLNAFGAELSVLSWGIFSRRQREELLVSVYSYAFQANQCRLTGR